jgi:hypothetical protein
LANESLEFQAGTVLCAHNKRFTQWALARADAYHSRRIGGVRSVVGPRVYWDG